MRKNTIKTFWQKVNKNGQFPIYRPSLGQCWEWTCTKNQKGYGRFKYKGWIQSSHRISYVLFKGKIPKGCQIDHLCRVPECVNPRHLEAVTPKENTRRGLNGPKKFCKKGHLFAKKTTMLGSRDNRRCKICFYIYQKRYRLENKIHFKEYNRTYKLKRKRLKLLGQT